MGQEVSVQQLSQEAHDACYDEPSWARQRCAAPSSLRDITQQCINTYMYSKQDDGTMGGLGWGWQTPNGYTAITLHDLWTGDLRNCQAIANAVKRIDCDHTNLTNEYNDDTLWWAMLCIHLFNALGDPWFHEKAKTIYRYLNNKHVICGRGQVKFRERDMEGACFWTIRDGEEAINTVTTGLYAELCARLALIDNRQRPDEDHMAWLQRQKCAGYSEYIEAARCSLGWILRCRYRSNEGLVLDGIMLKEDKEVDWTFTYVTGIALGVCALLYELLGQPEYLELALHMANHAMRRPSWVTESGILIEWDAFGHGKHDPWQNCDGVGFKAVLMRQLGTLYEVLTRTRPAHHKAEMTAGLIRSFVNTNMQSQQEKNTNGNGQYGPWWNGPFEAPTSHSQMAVLDVMAVASLVNR